MEGFSGTDIEMMGCEKITLTSNLVLKVVRQTIIVQNPFQRLLYVYHL